MKEQGEVLRKARMSQRALFLKFLSSNIHANVSILMFLFLAVALKKPWERRETLEFASVFTICPAGK